jgi:hypothetical protein
MVSKTSMPEVNASGEGTRTDAGGGRRLDRIQADGALTSVEYHPGTGVLNRKTKSVKFHSYRIVTRKSFDRD